MRKTQTPELVENCRVLWGEFDPIGVADSDSGVNGEYESYVPYTAELIASGAEKRKLTNHIENCVYINMGFERSICLEQGIETFVQKLLGLST